MSAAWIKRETLSKQGGVCLQVNRSVLEVRVTSLVRRKQLWLHRSGLEKMIGKWSELPSVRCD